MESLWFSVYLTKVYISSFDCQKIFLSHYFCALQTNFSDISILPIILAKESY